MNKTAPDPALTRISATNVSRALRKAGFIPVPNEVTRRGLKVTRGYDAQHVSLNADLNTQAARMMTAAKAALEAAGYTVDVFGDGETLATVTKAAPATAKTHAPDHILWADQYIAVETGDRLITRAYTAAQEGDGPTVRRAMAALMDITITLLTQPSGGMFSRVHHAALTVISAYLQALATEHRMPVTELAAPGTSWVAAIEAYSARSAEFSIKHVAHEGGLALTDEIGAAAAERVRTALHLPPKPTTEETR